MDVRQGARAQGNENRVHVDLAAADLEAEVGLGATRIADREEGGSRWVTLTDPESNEFDVIAVAS